MKTTFFFAATLAGTQATQYTQPFVQTALAQVGNKFNIDPNDGSLKVTYLAGDIKSIGQCFGLEAGVPIWDKANSTGFENVWNALETIDGHIHNISDTAQDLEGDLNDEIDGIVTDAIDHIANTTSQLQGGDVTIKKIAEILKSEQDEQDGILKELIKRAEWGNSRISIIEKFIGTYITDAGVELDNLDGKFFNAFPENTTTTG